MAKSVIDTKINTSITSGNNAQDSPHYENILSQSFSDISLASSDGEEILQTNLNDLYLEEYQNNLGAILSYINKTNKIIASNPDIDMGEVALALIALIEKHPRIQAPIEQYFNIKLSKSESVQTNPKKLQDNTESPKCEKITSNILSNNENVETELQRIDNLPSIQPELKFLDEKPSRDNNLFSIFKDTSIYFVYSLINLFKSKKATVKPIENEQPLTTPLDKIPVDDNKKTSWVNCCRRRKNFQAEHLGNKSFAADIIAEKNSSPSKMQH